MTCPFADRLTRSGVWLIAAILAAGPARAGLINVDFNDATANAGSPTATFAGAAAIGQAGDQWNGLNLADGWGDSNITKVYAGLIDTSGSASGVSLTLTGERCTNPWGTPLPFTGTYGALLQDCVSYSPKFVFSGLNNGSYDVYVYSGDTPTGYSYGSIKVNAASPKFFSPSATGTGLVSTRDYLLFNVTVSDGTLTIVGATGIGDQWGNRFAGFQIRSTWPAANWSSAGTSDWDTSGNWTPENGASVPPNALGASVNFKASGALNSVDIGGADRTVGNITFNNVDGASVTLASAQGRTLIFDNGSTAPTLTVNGSHAINSGVKLNGDLSIKTSDIADTLTLGGPISNFDATARGISVTGSGTLVLAAGNTYTGLTKVTSGTLSIASTSALPGWNINGRYTVSSGAGIAVGNGVSEAEIASMRATSNFAAGALLGFDTSAGDRSFPAIGGTLGLTKVGANKLTLTGSNSYGGVTKIARGTLEIGGSGTLGSGSYSGAIFINSGTLLNFTTSADQVLGSAISGGGGLAWNGAGTLTLNANSIYSGGVTVNSGILKSTASDAFQGNLQINPGAKAAFTNGLASSIGRTVVINGGTLDSLKTGQSADFSLAAVTLQGGLWAQTGSAYYDIYNNGVTGALPITSLASSTAATISANLHTRQSANFSGDMLFTVAKGSTASGVDLVVSGLLDPRGGSGNVTKAGPGLMAITSTNNLPAGGDFGTYAGATSVTDGTLQMGTGGATGSIDSSSGVSVAAGATLAFNRSDNPTFNLPVTGAGNLSQRGSGTVYLANPTSDYTGVTTLNAGVLNVSTLANVNTASPIGKGSPGGSAADLVINGGTLQHTAASAATNRLLTIGVNGATLDASSSFMNLGSGGGALAFATSNSPASLTLKGSGIGILAASVGNSGSGGNLTALTKSGTGSWTLTGANTYTGTTTLSGGKLYLNGDNATPTITVGTGATLGGTGSAIAATVTVAAGGSVEGGCGGAGSLTLDTLTFSGGGAVKVSNLGNYTSVPAIRTTHLTANGAGESVVISVSGSLPAGTGTSHLLEHVGGIDGTGFPAFVLDTASLPARSLLTLVNRSGMVDVDYTADHPVWSGGSWATNAGATWKLASNASATVYGANDAVVFDDTADSTTVTIVADVMPHSATFNNSLKNFSLGGAFGIAGGASLTKTGSGTLTISNANSYSGTTFVNGGVLQANNANALGSGSISFGGGTLQFTSASAGQDWAARIKNSTSAITLDTNSQFLTFAGNLDSSNRGGLTKAGLGTLTLSGTNTCVGITTVSGGTLQFSKRAALYNGVVSEWTPANIIVNSGATLMVNAGGANELSISDFTTLLDSVHLGGSSASTGLKSGSFIGIDTTNAGGNVDYSPVIANPTNGNAVGLVKNGSGTLNIGGKVNTYTGGTIVNGGILALGDASSSVIRRTLTVNAGAKVTFGNTLGYTGAADTRLSVINLYGGTLDRTSSGNSTTGGLTFNLRGGTLAHSGAGVHELWSGNGGVVINVEESPDASVISGNLQLDYTQLFTVANGAAATDLLVSGRLQGGYGITKAGPGAMALTAANIYTGATTVSAGTLLVNNTSGSGIGTAAVSVAVGATLGGTGSISGAVNVAGVLSPGTAVKTLTCGPVTLLSGATFHCEVDSSVSPGGAAALLNVVSSGGAAGDVTLNGAVSLTMDDIATAKTVFPAGTTFSLIHYTGTWNGGFFAFAGKQLTNGQEFTAGLNNWRINYAVTNPGRNFTGTPVAGTDKFINLTAIPFVGSATLDNLQAAAVTAHTATLRGKVSAIGNDAPSITLFYGPSDGITTPERWLNSTTLPGTYSNQFSTDISGLSPLTTYYFTARATNSAGDSWMVPAVTFRTTAIPPAVLTTSATAVVGTTATVGANVTDNGGENPTVIIYYGTTNGGTTPGAWAKSLNLGTASGPLSAGLTGLLPATNYYFRAFAQNSGGGVWAQDTFGFSTLPVSTPAVENRSTDGITGTTAVLHGRVTQVGNDPPVVTLFYGTTDGGTNPNSWTSSIILGNQSGDFTRFISGLSINTPYCFRWRAVNAAGTAWSAETATFTTTSQVPSTIVINEIHFNGVDNTVLNEFIEIFNAGTSPVVMSGWRLTGGIDYVFPADTSIAPNGYLIVAASPSTILTKYGKPALGPWAGSLSSDGETVRLRDATDMVIDEVDYKVGFPWPVAAGGDGASMERINPLLDGSLGASWRSSTLPADNATTDTVTPGAVNLQFAANAPPAIRQVQHLPQQPTSQDPIVITAKVTDLQGVASVTLSYQVVTPGNYIPRYLSNVPSGGTITKEVRTLNPAFDLAANWTTVPMHDDGTNGDVEYGDSIYTVVLPAQSHRTLLRYRITVTDSLGASVRVPYADDPAANFACFIYNGVPAYGTTTATTLQTLPVYQLITKASDWADCMGYDGNKQLGWSDPSRFYYNWNGTFVYDGVVYDNMVYRTRGANGRYQGSGKRSMRFKFNRGSYIAVRDQHGNFYPEKWQTISTCKGAENSGTLTYALNEWMNLRMWNAFGVPAPLAHYVHWRNVTTATEQADNYHGDFQGLMMVQEDYDVRFLSAHNMQKGNLYKLLNETDVSLDQQRYQAPLGAKNGSDHAWVGNINSSMQPAALTANVNLDKWDRYHAICQAVRHYDYWPNCDKNMVYYFEPDYTAQNGYRGKLWILPYDHDASWGPSWNSGVDNVYDALFGGSANTALRPDYYNTIRECRTLLFQPDQINPLLDEIASYIIPFQQADDARWKNAPADVGNYNGWGGPGSSSIANLVSSMKSFAFNERGAFMDQLGNSSNESTLYPVTPTISFIGTAGYPVNDLRFQTTAFNDPQGLATFGALQWRIAEVNTSATYTPGVKRLLEYEANHVSPEITAFGSTYCFPSSACEVGKRYRARVRHKDNTGRWSKWSAPAEFAAIAAPVQTLVHYWNFNDDSSLSNLLTANWTVGGAALSVAGTYLSGTGQSFNAANARNGDGDGAHLRVDNPLTPGTMVTFAIPTTGFENIIINYETRRSGTGAGIQNVAYTLDGTTYTAFASFIILDANPVVQSLNFLALPAANNNPHFGIRITFAQGAGSISGGNNRFDDFTVQGDALAGQSLPKLLPGSDAEWNTAANWANGSVPNSTATLAIVGAPATTDRSVTLVEPVTLGTLTMDNAGSACRNQITSALGIPLTFNGGGVAALLSVAGSGNGYIEFDLAGSVNLATGLRLNVSNIVGNHLANGDIGYGALRLRGVWTGSGGLIKQGLGVATLSGIGKTFTGPILIEQGVLSFTQPAVPAQASAITVQDGGQIRLVSGNDAFGARIYSFGCPLVLAGTGRGAGIPNSQHEGVLGAMRYDPDIGGTNRAIVTSAVTLAADAEIHIDGPDNTLELAGPVGGTGSLIKSGGGPVVLSGDSNTYSGNTIVTTGSLSISHPNFAPASTVTVGLVGGAGSVLNLPNAGTSYVAALVIGGVTMPNKTYDSTNSNGAITGLGKIQVGTTVTDYQRWTSQFAGFTLTDGNLDPDQDGMTNLQEYAFGLNPTRASSVNPISVPFDKATRKFSYTRRATSGMTYTVWTSTDLQTWTEDTVASTGQSAGAADADGAQTVVVTLTTVPAEGSMFVRVKATQP